MSGHSHWATIRRKKGAADAKRGQLFTRLAREIAIAVREGGGGDPASNIRLLYAIDRAKASNMPKDSIERAIKRGTGEDREANAYEEIVYEGHGPHGVAFMISCVTDNRNRTVAELRHILSKTGGSLGESGSVAWQFKRVAYFAFSLNDYDPDRIFELAVEAGADDVTFDDDWVEIYGNVELFKEISNQLKTAKIVPEEAELRYIPNMETELSQEQTLQVLRIVESLEDLDDVQDVYSNLAISDSVMAQLEAA
ncbi:MAG: YebC/PmpR family DNA-binding transcriptional regulator [Anaerolineales bacterium]|nr:YebC/PmpR family DNA-binding transcriptional regulator [Anaerolineales bacterium]